MSRRLTLALMILLLSGIYVTPAQSARMPRGSFLRQPAYSAAQLAFQIRRDAVVAARYEKHFGIPAARFASYVQSQLGLRPLQSNGSYRVFFIKKDGSIGSSVRTLRKGTAVFMHLRTGKPVLLAECGNPLGTGLPGYAAPASQGSTIPEPVQNTEAPTEQMPEEPLPPPMQSSPPDLFEDPVLAQMADPNLPAWQADVALSVPDLPVLRASSAVYAAPASLTPLFLVGASGLFSLGGGSSGRGGATPPPAVPEPASLVLWAVAGAGIALKLAKSKTCNR